MNLFQVLFFKVLFAFWIRKKKKKIKKLFIKKVNKSKINIAKICSAKQDLFVPAVNKIYSSSNILLCTY